jgi:metal-responsive CopG/Arc/MetJ family transcriptional regulator
LPVFGIDIGITIQHTMCVTKTAISVPDDLFNEVERFAKEHNYSRSEVFVRASKEYLERSKARATLDALNAAYGEEETEEETLTRKKGKEHYLASALKKEIY